MTMIGPRRQPLVLLLLFLAPCTAGAEDAATLLPEVAVRLKAARYSPSEPDFRWTGWIGAGAGLVRVRETTAYFTADVETIIGSVKRAVDANQANYHLEAGLRRSLGRHDATLFVHHVSRHAVDRPKDQAVDWNIAGVRGTLRLPEAPVPLRLTLSVGHTLQESLIGYRWELTARAEADLVTRPWGQVYLAADARGVTAESSPEFPRTGFVDASIEGGARFSRGGRSLDLFAAYEHRNDVRLEVPGSRDRALFGFRIGYLTSSPAAPR